MLFSRINYLFSEKVHDEKRDLYRAVLIAAVTRAKAVAGEFGCGLTDRTVQFSIDDILSHLPTDLGMLGQPQIRPVCRVYELIDAIQTLRAEDYLTSESGLDDFSELQLSDGLFEQIAADWANQKYGIDVHQVGNYYLYATSQARAFEIRSTQLSIEARKEVLAA